MLLYGKTNMQTNQTFLRTWFFGMCWDSASRQQRKLPGGLGGAVGQAGARWSVVVVHGSGPWRRSTAPLHPPPLIPWFSYGKEPHSLQPISRHDPIPAVGWIYWWGLVKQQKIFHICRRALSLSPIPFAADRGSCCQTWVLLFEWRLSALLLEHIPLPRG